MSLPGLNLSDLSKDKTTSVQLQKSSEWRFEVNFDLALKIKLIDGTAEIFGTELAKGLYYTFSGQKSAIFTWHGCTFEYSLSNVSSTSTSSPASEFSEYTSDETPMSIYSNLHFALENYRSAPGDSISPSTKRGPSVLVLGPKDSGKSSLCKLLCSYANKMNHFPMFVNLDPQEGVFAVPGALTAAPISDILDVESGWGFAPTNGPSPLHPKQPLSFYYGLESPMTNPKFYKHIVSRLGVGVAARLAADEIVNGSGIIIDTPHHLVSSNNTSAGYSIISNIVADFSVSVIVVVGHERLYADMCKRFKNRSPSLSVVKVPKSGGCVDRPDQFMRKTQSTAIQQYFYGSPRLPLAPFTVTVDYSIVTVYRVAEDTDQYSSTSVLPLPDDPTVTGSEAGAVPNSDLLIRMETGATVQNSVLAVLNAARFDPVESLVDCEVLGFVHVVQADDAKHKLKVLMPVPGRLPDRPFLMGDYRYHE